MLTSEQVNRSVAIDLDGTLAKYDGWRGPRIIGDPIPGAREFLQGLKDRGLYIIIHTARTCGDNSATGGTQATEDWLYFNNMPYDMLWTGKGKPACLGYCDDRGVSCRPQEDPAAYAKARDKILGLMLDAK